MNQHLPGSDAPMWIVKIALDRPYTFIILALLILLLSPIVIMRTPVDMFPGINIPVISMAWQYTGLNPEELEGRLTTPFEKNLTTFVDNVDHIESTTYNGIVVVRCFLQPQREHSDRQCASIGGLRIFIAPASSRDSSRRRS